MPGLYAPSGGVNRLPRQWYTPSGGVNQKLKEIYGVAAGVNRKVFSAYDCQGKLDSTTSGNTSKINGNGSLDVDVFQGYYGSVGSYYAIYKFMFPEKVNFASGQELVKLSNMTQAVHRATYPSITVTTGSGLSVPKSISSSDTNITIAATAAGETDILYLKFNVTLSPGSSYYGEWTVTIPAGSLYLFGNQINNIELI